MAHADSSSNYEPIGDGVYLYTAEDKKPTSDDMKQVRGMTKANQGFPTAQRNINDIMSNLEDEDKSITGLYLILDLDPFFSYTSR